MPLSIRTQTMTARHYNYLFGPVPSRRLGRSLGIDLIPFKTCSFDCIFCQLGRTTCKTIERKAYVPVDSVIAELDTWLNEGGTADTITLSGSGEPTLHAEFGRIIEFARHATDIPVALLTNGSLLIDPEVRARAAQANIVKVSLSAWDTFSYEQINRPHPDIPFKRVIDGQWQFRNQFSGTLWMEVFLILGTNTAPRHVAAIADLVRIIAPDKVQLNTAVRPPCESYAYAVPEAEMRNLAQLFDPVAEIIAEYSPDSSARVQANEADILEMLERRPCTLDEVCRVFGLHRNEVLKYLGKLTRTGRVIRQPKGAEFYYAGVHDRDGDGRSVTSAVTPTRKMEEAKDVSE